MTAFNFDPIVGTAVLLVLLILALVNTATAKAYKKPKETVTPEDNPRSAQAGEQPAATEKQDAPGDKPRSAKGGAQPAATDKLDEPEEKPWLAQGGEQLAATDKPDAPEDEPQSPQGREQLAATDKPDEPEDTPRSLHGEEQLAATDKPDAPEDKRQSAQGGEQLAATDKPDEPEDTPRSLHGKEQLAATDKPDEPELRQRGEQPERATLSLATPKSLAGLLKELDDISTDDKLNLLGKINDIWEPLAQGREVLEGESYEMCITLLLQHMQQEAKEKNFELLEKTDHRRGFHLPPEKVVREWIISVVDPDGDGKITKEEAIQGLKKVVDEIETGQDYEREKVRKLSSVSSRQNTQSSMTSR
jgi:hypothetical protein